ncbi:MAG TPA: nitrite reductase small subunit NirD [Candidatus Eisenbacteria bacterium]|nr:nitrite reductase small subunit NirD [Candidatus Eisenbacteria bacterium]
MAQSVTLCPVDVIPENGGRQFRIDGREVAVFKVDGKLYALDGKCPHRGGPLGFGDVIEGQRVMCPWHAWSFDLQTGACDVAPLESVRTFPVRVEDGQVVIEIDLPEPDPQP